MMCMSILGGTHRTPPGDTMQWILTVTNPGYKMLLPTTSQHQGISLPASHNANHTVRGCVSTHQVTWTGSHAACVVQRHHV